MHIFFMDVGSTFVKYAVYDTDVGAYVQRDKLPFPSPVIADGIRFEVDRADIDRVILSVLETAVAERCTKAFISVQMHGYLLRQNGSVGSYVSWQDQNGDPAALAHLGIDLAARGTRLKRNLPLVKLYPRRETLRSAELFTLGSYICWLLTGNNRTHITDACASGFFTVDGAADTGTVPGLTLPQVGREVECCGRYKNIDIYTPLGDHAVSFLGSGADGDAYLLNIGTASQIAFLAEECGSADLWEYRPYFEKDKRLVTLSGILAGGGTLDTQAAQDRMCADILAVLDALPRRARLLLGGGGADRICEKLSSLLAARGVECCKNTVDIGMEGLRMIAQQNTEKLGIMLSEIAFTNMPLLLKNNGFDFMIVDNEHGAFDYTFLAKTFTVARLAGLPTVVRLPDNTRAWITKCADAGADGFLLPMTNCAEDIAAVVGYAKYAPIGKRGISTMRAHTLYAPPSLDEYMPAANERVKVYAQIETAKGVENIDAILAVNGVDGVFVGPNDLSADLDCIGDTAPILACFEKVAAAAKTAGKPWGIITTSKTLLDKATELSVGMVSYGSELHMLDAECKRIRKIFT